MAQCPICDADLEEWNPEWISEAEELFQASCEKCGWSGTSCHVITVEFWDERTNADVPTNPKEFKAWREENAKHYNV